jgi:hypothetical protein
VDVKRAGFACVDENQKDLFIPFDQGRDKVCASPKDTEAFLKACKAHKLIEITLCSWDTIDFKCKDPSGASYGFCPACAENYFCLSEKDWGRVKERCI